MHRLQATSRKKPETLDQVIARRVAFLTDYQDAACADRFEAWSTRVRKAEAALGSETLTDAVARSLFKLMAYKDEYEVARLHMETGFLDELQQRVRGRLHGELSSRAAPAPVEAGCARPPAQAQLRPLDPDAAAACSPG